MTRDFPHLASVNPYIGSALASGGPGGCPAAAHLPREAGGAAAMVKNHSDISGLDARMLGTKSLA